MTAAAVGKDVRCRDDSILRQIQSGAASPPMLEGYMLCFSGKGHGGVPSFVDRAPCMCVSPIFPIKDD